MPFEQLNLQYLQNLLLQYNHSYFHSVLRYGILFWGNSPICRDIFRIQKRAMRITTSKGRRESCRELFKELKILTLPSQYIHLVLVFVMKNRGLFIPNNDIHDHNTRHNLDFHLPTTHLSIVQRMYSGFKIFKSLPTHLKIHIDNPRHFKKKTNKYLMEHSFYKLEKYYQRTS